MPLEDYKKNITAIVDQAQAAGVKVVILTSTMIREDQATAENQKLVPYNEFLRALATEKKCLLADLNADLQAAIAEAAKAGPVKGNVLTSDGVHMASPGNEMMAALLVAPTTTAGALDAVGCDGCSALWWAESRGMHAVAQSLRDSGATAGRRPALELCRGEADAADVDMKGQTVEFSGRCATLRSAERCRLGKRKYWELQVLKATRASDVAPHHRLGACFLPPTRAWAMTPSLGQ